MKIEFASSEERERYLVRHPREVRRILEALLQDRAIVTAHAEDGRSRMLTAVVGLDPEDGFLYLDCGADEEMNARLTASREVILTTTHDGVPLQITCRDLTRVRLGDAQALRATLPRELLRLQRREYYRLATSLVNPVTCRIPTPRGDLDTTVVDLSVGGIGILAYRQDLPLEVGRDYAGCDLRLPALGRFAVRLEVRSTFEVVLRNGRRSRRAGCRFLELPPALETAVQRYINEAQRERRRRYL